MKIKLAILDKDQNYLNGMVSTFGVRYADKLEIYSFTNAEAAISSLDSARIDVFLVDQSFDINPKLLPKRCGFAYFVDSVDIETINDRPAICRFQKADLIYRQILSIYSENAVNVSGIKLGDDSSKIIIFSSPCGGVGTSTLAAACAQHYSEKGKKTLYLNLEKYGSSDLFFSGEGQFDMSDIIFALKSKKANLSLKLESCVKQDSRGVYFYSQPKIALDMLELTTEDILRLVSEINLSGVYDYIILDIDFEIIADLRKLFLHSLAIVWIGDGSVISNCKIARAYTALSTKEQAEDVPITNRILLIYNKFSNKSSKTVGLEELKNIGGAPFYKGATEEQLLGVLSKMDMFDKIG